MLKKIAGFWKLEALGQTVLPDRSILIAQKSLENAKKAKIQMRLFDFFQTLWSFQGPIKKLVT